MTEYLVYDVFTETRFGGNQLAVIPDAAGLPERDLLPITREFNFSETVFLYPPEDAAHTAKVRIFTPGGEVPFAGHPTIGTAVALAEAGHGPDMVLELGVGPLAARAADGAAHFTTRAALERIAEPDPALCAAALGLDPAQVASPPVMASLGLAFTFVELDSREALSACRPDTEATRRAAGMYPSELDFALYAYVREGSTIHARMFAPLVAIPEDPATGSAAATLAALLAEAEGRDLNLELRQGDDMGRPSRIGLATDGPRITVSGRALRVMQGRLV